jgi:hypothetical protein
VNQDLENGYEEEVELSSEELFQIRQQEIAERFEEKGFFSRLGDMFSGLSRPRSSREYKLARIELQRLMAPLVAILCPVLGVIALIVITAVTSQPKKTIEIEVARVQEEEQKLEDEVEPEVEPEKPPEEQVDVQVDTPTMNNIDVSTPQPVQNEPVSVKPATQDSVAIIKSPVTMRSMTGSRSPGSIGVYTSGKKGYGDANTEAAVLKALRWLKKTQTADGSWPADKNAKTSNTALAVLTYLAHGETPASKEFGETVKKAMNYLIAAQYTDKAGTVRFKHSDGNEYAFLIATYALCETYGMTRNPNVKPVAMKALERIVQNQSPTGGWDYKLKKGSTRDDLSFAGWALQALKAGKMAGMAPEGLDACIKKAVKCLKTRNFRGGGFGYCAGHKPDGLTATGCLAMQLLGYSTHKEVIESLDYMRKWKPSFNINEMTTQKWGHKSPQYYCYYASQCKYQAGMRRGANKADEKTWQDWNQAMKMLYPRTIKADGQIPGPDGKMRMTGYWEHVDPLCRAGGKTMATCLCALQLMVYYRYLPTTQTSASSAEDGDTDTKAKKAEVEVEVDI